MRVRVDHGADAVYVNLTDRPIKESEEVADGIVVDYDNQGRIVGVEILDASKRHGRSGGAQDLQLRRAGGRVITGGHDTAKISVTASSIPGGASVSTPSCTILVRIVPSAWRRWWITGGPSGSTIR